MAWVEVGKGGEGGDIYNSINNKKYSLKKVNDVKEEGDCYRLEEI